MKARAEREHELRFMVATGGYRLGQVVALYLNATPPGERGGLTSEHMIDVILDDEERRGVIGVPPPSADISVSRSPLLHKSGESG